MALLVLPLALAGCGGEDIAQCAALRRSAAAMAMEHCNAAIENRLVRGERRARVRLDRGALQADAQNWSGAISDVSAAIDSGKLPEKLQAVAHYDRGTAYLRQGDPDSALADFDEALRREPSLTDGYVNRAVARRAKGDLKGAQADAGTALKLNPQYAKAFIQRGITSLAAGDADKAQADLAEAVKLEPGLSAARHLHGVVLRSRGNLEGALAEYDEAIRLDAKNADAWRARAEIRLARQDHARALADLEAALKLEPRHADALSAHSRLLAQRGDFVTALQEADRVIRLAPKAPGAYFGRGLIHREKKDSRAALADFEQALALDERHIPARANRVLLMVEAREHARALADLEAIARQAPASADHRMAGLMQFYLGAWQDSAQAMARALSANPADHYAALLRFIAQSRAGQAKEARADLAEAAKALPASGWPAPVVAHYLGKAAEPAVFAAAGDADDKKRGEQICEANFYVAMARLLRGPASAALPHLKLAQAECPRDFVEHVAADEELKRLTR